MPCVFSLGVQKQSVSTNLLQTQNQTPVSNSSLFQSNLYDPYLASFIKVNITLFLHDSFTITKVKQGPIAEPYIAVTAALTAGPVKWAGVINMSNQSQRGKHSEGFKA